MAREGFDIAEAVAAWRRRLECDAVLDSAALDELEAHLWEAIEHETSTGALPREAFERAVWFIGKAELLETEYRKLDIEEGRHRFGRRHHPLVFPMLLNYLKIAFRSLRKYKGYSFINVFGLAVGLASCILIVLYVQDELSFDRMHTRADRIYRIVERRNTADGEQGYGYTTGPLADAMVASIPEVVGGVRLVSSWNSGRVSVGEGSRRFYEGDHLIAGPVFFDVFDFEVLEGDPATALNDPNAVVLTASAAHKYFGDVDPLGKTLPVARLGDFTVTGVLQDPPPNSHLGFSMVFSMATLEAFEGWRDYMNSWESTGMIEYVVLAEGASPDAVQAKMARLLAQNQTAETLEQRHPYLQPITDIHFGSGAIEFERNQNEGTRAYVFIFSAIALFVVLIACINYMNMATARSMGRAKEVGMRKVAGAHRSQLVGQFLSESVLITLLALVIALGLVVALLPSLNALAGKAISIDVGRNTSFLLSTLLIVTLVGVVSGSYPAFYLSQFHPAQVLKGGLRGHPAGSRLRRVLIVTQFTLSIVMIVATLVVFQQLQYVQHRQLGFNQDHLVTVDINSGGVRSQFEAMRAELANSPAVRSVTVSSRVPGDWKNIAQIDVRNADAPEDGLMTAYFLGVDERFLGTYQMQMVEGRNFSPAFNDSTSVVLNETAARRLGASVGSELFVPSTSLGDEEAPPFRPRVIGIVKDFNYRSLHERIGPMVLGAWNNPIESIDYFTLRVNGARLQAALDHAKAVHERFDKVTPVEINFLDQRLADFYVSDRRVMRIFGIAAGLSILIACMGLFGLAAFTAEQRTKEVGVRKVLGATVPSVMLMFSYEFIKLVAVAFVVGAPLAYFAMRQWLNAFAYRITLGPSIFLVAGAAVLLIALATVSYQSVRAALTNPARALRYE